MSRTLGLRILATAALVLMPLGPSVCCGQTERRIDAIDLLTTSGLRVVPPAGTKSTPAGQGRTIASWGLEDAPPNEWRIRTYRGQSSGGVTTDTAHSGTRAFCLAAITGAADADAQLHIEIKPGTQYEFDAYLRAVDLDPNSAKVFGTFYVGEFSYRSQDNSDRNDAIQWHFDLPMFRGTTTEWQHVHSVFRTAPTARMLRIAASLGNWGTATGTLCFDDVTLTEVGAASRLESTVDTGALIQMVSVGRELRRGLLAYPSSEYRYALVVPPAARLSFAVGIEDEGWSNASRGVRFEVAAVVNGQTQPLYSRTVDAAHADRDRQWQDAAVALDAYAGQSIELVFRSDPVAADNGEPGHPRQAGEDLAAWANPTLYVPRSGVEPLGEPNIFLISVDTLRADHLGCYKYARDTSPSIDRLAKDGVLFEQAFTTIPRTTPAIASMMTGLEPRAHGVMTLVDLLSDEQTTLAEVLAARGYVTAASVTHNVSRRTGLQQGFDTYADHLDIGVEDPRARAEPVVARARAWIDAHAGQKMFFWLHIWDPHFRYAPPPPYDGVFDPEGAAGFDLYDRLDRGQLSVGQLYFHNDLTARQVAHAVALYDGEVRYADAILGQFLQNLKDLGLYDNAMLVFTADHGESLGEQGYFFEHGEYLYDSTLHIPLIIKWPDARRKGLRVATPTMIVDIMPTILAAIGAPKPSSLAGKDLGTFLDDKDGPHPECYAETDRSFFVENPRRYLDGVAGNWKSVRSGRWKLIEIPTPDKSRLELYDTEVDPGETVNLYRPEDARAAELADHLTRWLASFERPRAPRPTANSTVDAATAERLRALGYMNR